MFDQVPDECKQLLWSFFDATELCRVPCVARDADRGVQTPVLWKTRVIAMVKKELAQFNRLQLPVEGGLRRQNASRKLGNTPSFEMPECTAYRGLGGIEVPWHDTACDSSFWRDWYRDFYLSKRMFDNAHAVFTAAKAEQYDLKKQRGDLRDLLQATKNMNQNEKQLRRMQMNCVRWINRSQRRLSASSHSRSAQHAALSKAELQDELRRTETALQTQSQQLFSSRSRYQKRLHQLMKEVARGTRILADLHS